MRNAAFGQTSTVSKLTDIRDDMANVSVGYAIWRPGVVWVQI